jgi:hypothetical protein
MGDSSTRRCRELGGDGLNNCMTVEAYFAKATKVLQISVPTITANYRKTGLMLPSELVLKSFGEPRTPVPYKVDQVAETNDAFDVNTGRR